MNLKILMVGGPEAYQNQFRQLVRQNAFRLEIIGATVSIGEATSLVKTLQPDLLALYVDAPLQQLLYILDFFSQPKFEIVFIVEDVPELIQTLQMINADYLISPVQTDSIKTLIDRILKRRQHQMAGNGPSRLHKVGEEILFSKLAIASNNGFIFAEKNEIIACEASRNYTFFFLKDQRKLVASKPLKYFEDLLEKEYYFFRINRSFIINLHYLDGYIRSKRGEIVLTNGMRLRLSENRKEAFLRRIDLMAG